jgi:lambda family phage tail tape measure protein
LGKSSIFTSTALAGIGSAVSVVGFASFVKNGIDALDMLGDLSDRTGIAASTLAGFQLVAKQSDTSIEALGLGLNKLSVYMAKNAEDARKLGLTAKDPAEAFIQLSGVLSNIQDVQLRNAVANQVLGKSYQELLPALVQGEDALRGQIKAGQDYARVTPEAVAQAQAFNDKLDGLKVQADLLTVSLASRLLPNLNEITSAMTEAANESGILMALWVGLGGVGDLVFNGTKIKQTRDRIVDLEKDLKKFEARKKALEKGDPILEVIYGSKETNAALAKTKKDLESANQSLQNLTAPPKAKATAAATSTQAKIDAERKAKELLAKDENARKQREGTSAAKSAQAEAKRRADEAKRTAEEIAKAELALQETLRTNAAKFTESQLEAAIATNKREYDQKIITAEQYYGRMQALETQRADNELRLLQANIEAQQAILNSNASTADKLKARAEISTLNTEIAAVQTKLQTLTQDTATELVSAQYQALEAQIDAAFERLRQQEQKIANQQQNGLAPAAAEKQINEVRKETIGIVDALIKKLEELAAANQNATGTQARATVERAKRELEQTTANINRNATDLNNAIDTTITSELQGVISGAKSAEDAVLGFLNTIVNEMVAITARQLGRDLLASILPTGASGAGGVGGIFAGLFGGGDSSAGSLFDLFSKSGFGFAEGGYTGNGGKYQPKGVVHGGEFVFSQEATRALGVNALAHLHNLAKGGTLPTRPRFSYADGGAVNLPNVGGGTVQNTNIIAIDKNDVQNAAWGGADSKLINLINLNRGAINAALGRG